MKGLNVLVAFLGGAAIGAAVGIFICSPKKEKTLVTKLQKSSVKGNSPEP